MTHYYYGIGGCQHAEAICLAMEKMHIEKRDYLTENKWNDFMFELTDDELEDLRCKNCTANLSSKSRYNPHVFTEQGLYMLMTILKGPLAVKQRKALIVLSRK